MCKTVDCGPVAAVSSRGGSAVRVLGIACGVLLGFAVLSRPVLAAFHVAAVVIQVAVVAGACVVALGVLAVAAAVSVRLWRWALAHWPAREAARPVLVRAEVQPRPAVAAAPLAIESGLLAGQADPAMREVLRGISRGLRERYGEPSTPARVVPGMVSGEEVMSYVERHEYLFEQQQLR